VNVTSAVVHSLVMVTDLPHSLPAFVWAEVLDIWREAGEERWLVRFFFNFVEIVKIAEKKTGRKRKCESYVEWEIKEIKLANGEANKNNSSEEWKGIGEFNGEKLKIRNENTEQNEMR
jgi:hypothetical protein